MSALITGSASAAVVTALSPWILPLIAIAAKRKEDEARAAGRSRLMRYWFGRRAGARGDVRQRPRGGTDERLKAKREATNWPD